MPDYQKGKIYKIVDLTTDECYIGSTCEPTLARRLAGHRNDYKTYLKGGRTYIKSFDIIKNENYDIQLIENFPCDSKDELHKREGYWIKTMNCVNKMVAGQTRKEYYEANKDMIKNYHHLYYQTNKAELNGKNKKYHLEHKDKMQENMKQYYNANKASIALRQSKKFDCECGGTYTSCHKAEHMRSIKHTTFINKTL